MQDAGLDPEGGGTFPEPASAAGPGADGTTAGRQAAAAADDFLASEGAVGLDLGEASAQAEPTYGGGFTWAQVGLQLQVTEISAVQSRAATDNKGTVGQHAQADVAASDSGRVWQVLEYAQQYLEQGYTQEQVDEWIAVNCQPDAPPQPAEGQPAENGDLHVQV